MITLRKMPIIFLIVCLLLGIGCAALPAQHSQTNIPNDQASDNYQYIERPMVDSNSTSPIGNIKENDNSSPSPDEIILGTWRYFAEGSGPIIFIYDKDGVGEMFMLWAVNDNDISVVSRHFIYHINNNIMTVKFEDEDEQACKFEINNKAITIIESDNTKSELERISSSALSTTEIEKELFDATCVFAYSIARNAILEKNYEYACSICSNLYTNYKDRSVKATELYEKLLDELYITANEYLHNEEYEDAYEIYNELSGLDYRDSIEKTKEACYLWAISLVDVPEFEHSDALRAFHIFEELGSYKDSKEWLAALKANVSEIGLKYAEKGDYVTFGVYEQDGDYYNGKEDIEWIVLDRQGDRLLLISKYILFSSELNPIDVDTTWENCAVRYSLNNEMFYESFTENERRFIMRSKIETTYCLSNGLNSGNDTNDYLFVLSWEDIKKYLPTNYQRVASSPRNPRDYRYWWVRTPGVDNHFVESWWWPSDHSNMRYFYSFINKNGEYMEEAVDQYSLDISSASVGIISNKLGVRPAMWVDVANVGG